EHVDAGAKPHEIFASVCSYSAQDPVSFLVDYISELLDSGGELYASELIDQFAPYVPDDGWFVFLYIRLTALTDPVKANQLLAALFERKEAMTLALLMEALSFIVVYGEKPLFLAAVRLTLPLL